jgi:hypothetical protein
MVRAVISSAPLLRSRSVGPVLAALAALGSAHALVAQDTVTAITTTTTFNGTNQTGQYGANNISFANDVVGISTITAGGIVFRPDVSATTVFVRRNGTQLGNPGGNAGPNIWQERVTAPGAIPTSLSSLNPTGSTFPEYLNNNNVLAGTNDVFVNTGGSPANTVNSNVERIDYYFSGGFTVGSNTNWEGFFVADRGGSDPFQIAVFTGFNTGTNLPTAYGGNVIEVAASEFGTTDLRTPTNNYGALRYQEADANDLNTLNSYNDLTGAGLKGVFISMADLGIAVGTQVFGYSLMAPDAIGIDGQATSSTVSPGVTLSTALVSFTNATYFPSTTSDINSGSIDLMNFNSRLVIVPEPAAYGAMSLLGSALMVFGLRRPRRRAA